MTGVGGQIGDIPVPPHPQHYWVTHTISDRVSLDQLLHCEYAASENRKQHLCMLVLVLYQATVKSGQNRPAFSIFNLGIIYRKEIKLFRIQR